MDKKKGMRYLFLTVCVIILSILVPYMIRMASTGISRKILNTPAVETEEQTEDPDTDKKISVGNPDLYVEDPYGNVFTSEEDKKAYRKYQDLVNDFSTYVEEFTTETKESSQVSKKEITSFLKKDPGQFFEAAASYAYSRWGSERKIKMIKFDSIISYTDDDGNDITQAMVEFLHTSHPDTETGNAVICMYYKADGFYYFP